jgi:hypothetical protein
MLGGANGDGGGERGRNALRTLGGTNDPARPEPATRSAPAGPIVSPVSSARPDDPLRRDGGKLHPTDPDAETISCAPGGPKGGHS